MVIKYLLMFSLSFLLGFTVGKVIRIPKVIQTDNCTVVRTDTGQLLIIIIEENFQELENIEPSGGDLCEDDLLKF